MANEKTQNALLYYRGILEITRDVFGDEKMTDDVISQAVSTAGYGACQIARAETSEELVLGLVEESEEADE